MLSLWRARRTFAPEADIPRPDDAGGALDMLGESWACRRKAPPGTTSAGRPRRQILDILLPGDTIGRIGVLTGESAPGVRALTAVPVGVHDPRSFATVHRGCSGLCRAMKAGDQRDIRRLDQHLTVLGQANAAQRLGFTLHDRLAHRRLVAAGTRASCACPGC